MFLEMLFFSSKEFLAFLTLFFGRIAATACDSDYSYTFPGSTVCLFITLLHFFYYCRESFSMNLDAMYFAVQHHTVLDGGS